MGKITKYSRLFFFKPSIKRDEKIELIQEAIDYAKDPKNKIDDILFTSSNEHVNIYTINLKENNDQTN